MDREKINFFKSELRNLRYYNRKIDEAKKEREKAINKLTGVKSPNENTEIISSATPSGNANLYYWMHKEEEYTAIINEHQKRVDYVWSVLNKMEFEDRKAVIEIYSNNKNRENIALTCFMDVSTLQRRIDKLINKFA